LIYFACIYYFDTTNNQPSFLDLELVAFIGDFWMPQKSSGAFAIFSTKEKNNMIAMRSTTFYILYRVVSFS